MMEIIINDHKEVTIKNLNEHQVGKAKANWSTG